MCIRDSGNIQTILDSGSDVISFQELTPDWGMELATQLKKEYPYQQIVYRQEDFLGVGMFSKIPFIQVDTFYHEDKPNLAVRISKGLDEVAIISSFVYPELSTKDIKTVNERFESLQSYLSQVNVPYITCGDYNQVQWSSHLLELKRNLHLSDSRRFQFFSNPTDHIFFSQHFNCIDFQTINNRYTNHLGIKGSYQINRNFVDVQKAVTKF